MTDLHREGEEAKGAGLSVGILAMSYIGKDTR